MNPCRSRAGHRWMMRARTFAEVCDRELRAAAAHRLIRRRGLINA